MRERVRDLRGRSWTWRCGVTAGREREESDQWTVASGAPGVAHSGSRDRRKDGREPFGIFELEARELKNTFR